MTGTRRRRLKLRLYRAARAAGLFAAARRLTAGSLRILCFHGVAPGDLATFRPRLFLTPETFRGRLALIERCGHPVLPLVEAIERARAGTLPPAAVALTFDDGFDGLPEHAAPALAERAWPWTLYVATEYVEEQLPVLILSIQYALWLSERAVVTLDGLGDGLPAEVALGDGEQREAAAVELTEWARANLPDEAARSAWAARVAERAGVSWERVTRGRHLHMLTEARLRELAAAGVDLQLHTHIHFLTGERAQLEAEIARNRAILEPIVGRPLTHFCYPSGWHRTEYGAWLDALGIETATTCDPGLIGKDSPPLYLDRFVDGEDITEIEVEAELSGFAELLRRGLGRGR